MRFGPLTFASTLSANTVTVEIVDGRLEVTHESYDGNTSWGEGLSEEDTESLLDALRAIPSPETKG